jgi:WD40 repeat protein
MADPADRFASPERPFIGLRPFAYEDWPFYFGRDEQIDKLEELLLTRQLISVVGSSGSGKSSLVRAGLMPRIISRSVFGSSGWAWAEMRPGEEPIRKLAEALARPNQTVGETPHDPLAEARADRIEARLQESSFGIRDSLELVGIEPGRQLVILVDQFEEIFRFADLREQRSVDPRQAAEQRDEATLFVQLLLAAANDPDFPGRIILTMRSDFIGECARFHRLSEEVTASQYLVPALTRDQRAEVIRHPIVAAGGTIEPALVQRLLNDTNEDLDQLPVLQHAMMRCWQLAARQQSVAPNLTLQDYAEIGGIENALARHADELLADLQHEDQADTGALALGNVARRLFQCLTDTDSHGRTIRRPQTVGDLVGVLVADTAGPDEAAAAERAVRRVIAHFSDLDCSFLRAPPADDITDATVIDIGHEALIRRWERLGGLDTQSWVKEEQRDGEQYGDLVRLASVGSLIEEDRLPIFEAWWRERQPNRRWARRYSRGGIDRLDDARAILIRSKEVIAARHRAQLAERRRRLRERIVVGAFGLFLLIAAGGAAIYVERQNAETAEKLVSEGARGLARMAAVMGMEALTAINPHSAVLMARWGLQTYGPQQAAKLHRADEPELYLLAYAALQQMREQRIIRVGRTFMALAFDNDDNMMTFLDRKLRIVDRATSLGGANGASSGSIEPIDLPYATNIEASTDGTTVLVANSLQTYIVDRAKHQARQLTAPGTDGSPVGVGTMSRDGELILTTKRGDPPRLWRRERDSQTGEISFRNVPDVILRDAIGAPMRDGTAVAISADGRFVAVGAADGRVNVYRVGDGQLVKPLDSSTPGGRPSPASRGQVWMLAFDPNDSGLLLAADQNNRPRLYRWRDGTSIDLFGGDDAFRVAFSPDGKLIAAPSQHDQVVDVWRTASVLEGGPRQTGTRQGEVRQVRPWVRLHSDETFFQVAFDQQNRLAGGSPTGSVWLWDLRASALSLDLPDEATSHEGISIPIDQPETLATRTGTTFAVDLTTKRYAVHSSQPDVASGPIKTPRDPDWNPLNPADTDWLPIGIALSADGKWLALTPEKGQVLLYDLRRTDGKPVAAFGEANMKWRPAAFAEDPPRVVATPLIGSPMAWRYFESSSELLSFIDKSLPLQIDLTGETTQACSVTLSPSIMQELSGNFWPALTRVMGSRTTEQRRPCSSSP